LRVLRISWNENEMTRVGRVSKGGIDATIGIFFKVAEEEVVERLS
jgi:hypothetical protein